MKQEQLLKANELVSIVGTTTAALDQLLKLRSKRRELKESKGYDDGQYSLCISEHRDGSGCSAQLNRYLGNADLLDIIIKTVQDQLLEFEREFESI